MFLTISRTFKEALKNFTRNGWLSIATVSILTMSLFVISVFFVVTLAVDDVLQNVQERVNISIYFKSDVSVENINAAKADLEKFKEIKSVEYVSKEQALESFKNSSIAKPIIMQALDEIGGNPLWPSLAVKTTDSRQYELISEYVKKSNFSTDVSSVNYAQNKENIDKLNKIIITIRKIGIVLGLLFTIISLLVTFNAIRITIYTHKNEVEIMRLVGASNSFIRLPFIFEGVIYGILSSVVSMILLVISIKLINIYLPSVTLVSNLMSIYSGNFWSLLGGQILLGSLLGIIGSLIAMRKYLKV
ncbi:MAG: permease-like cell division protein FtsX [Candidatus Moranbacteria bacterium]|nr:permease-like cell division protein FtsX [Candidatus Moranbacteria bacterium]